MVELPQPTDSRAPARRRTARVRRLSWAGVLLETPGTTLVIDPLLETEHLTPIMGPARGPLVEAPAGSIDLALLSHPHPDHFHPGSLRRLLGPGGQVGCPADMEREVTDEGFTARPLEAWESLDADGLTVWSAPAVDGFGDPQLSWVVETAGGAAVFHGGDTLWHGHWWQIACRHGPFDVAFLPINGVHTRFDGIESSGQPVTLTPSQAAAAGRLLRARLVCPIHYGLFDDPDGYAEFPRAEESFREAAREERVRALVLRPGASVSIPHGGSG